MPNWSDDDGRCHFEVDGIRCYESPIGCPAHRKPHAKRDKSPQVMVTRTFWEESKAQVRALRAENEQLVKDANEERHVAALLGKQVAALRADLAKAQARCAELEAALKDIADFHFRVECIGEPFSGGDGCTCGALDRYRAAIASDGTSALAAVSSAVTTAEGFLDI